jgi:hypothetical protein
MKDTSISSRSMTTVLLAEGQVDQEKIDSPTPMKTEQAWNGLYLVKS